MVGDTLGRVEVAWSFTGGFAGSFEPLLHPGWFLAVAFVGGALVQRQPDGVADRPGYNGRATWRGHDRADRHAGAGQNDGAFGDDRTTCRRYSDCRGQRLAVLAPLVGVLGTFVTGSTTSSNVLFTELQVATAEELALPQAPMVAAQGFGAAVGARTTSWPPGQLWVSPAPRAMYCDARSGRRCCARLLAALSPGFSSNKDSSLLLVQFRLPRCRQQ